MADETPNAAEGQPPAAPAAAPAAAATTVTVATLEPPPAPRAPDSVTLTRREQELMVERAVAEALKAVQDRSTMSDEKKTDPLPSEEMAKINARIEEALAAAAEAKATADKRVAEVEEALKSEREKREAAEAKAEEERKARRRAKDKVVEANLRKAAAKAGIEDEDYALVLYARAASKAVTKKDEAGNPAPEAPPAPEEFFAGLVKEKPGLLKAGAPQPPAPPARTVPAAADSMPQPSGHPAAAKPQGEDVDEMNERDFAQRTRNKYGFNPTVAV